MQNNKLRTGSERTKDVSGGQKKSLRYVHRLDRHYKKECTLHVHDIPNTSFNAETVIETVEKICGENTVLAVVPVDNNNGYEITTDSEESAWQLTNGLKIDNENFECTLQFNQIVVVSFIYLPAYIEDQDIIDALEIRNCEIKSSVFRHVHPKTQVADGTRYVHVKFPPTLVSLPWSMKFKTVSGDRYFRVMHDKQKSLCNKCGSPYHKYRKCPQLVCDGCDEQGHKMRECKAPKCETCRSLPSKCWCGKIDKICPYCRKEPCVCACEGCKLAFNLCKCGTDNTDRDLTKETTDTNENGTDKESDMNVGKKKENVERKKRKSENVDENVKQAKIKTVEADNNDHTSNEDDEIVEVNGDDNDQMMSENNKDGDTDILNLEENTCEEDDNVVNGDVVDGDAVNDDKANSDVVNGEVVNGGIENGEVVNDEVVNGKVVNGKVVNGEVVNGEVVNGKVVNGKVVNGKAVNGKLVNGEVVNGKLVNGKVVNGDVSKAADSDEDIVVDERDDEKKENSQDTSDNMTVTNEQNDKIVKQTIVHENQNKHDSTQIQTEVIIHEHNVADSSSGGDVTRTGIGDLDNISPVGASGTDGQDHEIEVLMDVSEGGDGLSQTQSQKSSVKRRNKTKHTPNVNSAKMRVRSTPYEKNVNNGSS
ncbi:Hypothetical predicted protein [Mytilus galloprovincialis]|uniref:CCHC-type domain-containing protein n=2 Tax=Mytilus galloprovincialis TaxID=29158 RepID=A0A8B6F6Z8_MYTGA|nr:Hypothetical predicted protein [Mytilus galloprovincialis]